MNLRRWLTPGIGVKRWMLVVFVGLLLLALAFAHMLRQATRDLAPGGPVGTVIDTLTLQFLPYPVRGLIVATFGLGIVIFGAVQLGRALTDPFRSDEEGQPLVELIYQKRFLARGPRIVAIGGGTGLSALLRGLKEHTSNLTAVVTVADDGGSSGVLRESLGIPPVGDIRNCIAALADAEPLMNELLQYRFPETAEGEAPGLGGHAVGNLLLAAMTAVEGGDFEEGVRRINRILAVRGQVVPVSAEPLTLHAQLADGSVVDGQSSIMAVDGIQRLWLTPKDVPASTDALRAIAEADLIVIGPGSLFTSLLPSLLMPEIREALLGTPAPIVYVCNVATQAGRDGRLRPGRARRSARRAHRPGHHRPGPGEQSVRCPDTHRLARRARRPSLAAGRAAGPAPRPRRRGGSRERPPSRPGPAGGCRPAGVRAGQRRPTTNGGSHGLT